MAVQFDSTGDLLFRLASAGALPARYPLSVAFFLRIDADSGQASPAWVRYADSGSGAVRQSIQVDSTGATDIVQIDAQTSGGETTGTAFTQGVWRAVGLRVHSNGASLDNFSYLDGSPWESINSADIADTSPAIAIGGTGADTPKMSIAGLRIWQDELSDPEFLAEAASLTPVRSSNLWASYQFTSSGTLTTDSSGNGRSLTSNGSPTFVADPAVGGVSAASSIATGATATTQATVSAAAASSVATGATSTNVKTAVAAAAASVATTGTATASITGAAAASSSITTDAAATNLLVESAAAASSIATGSAATTLSTGTSAASSSITTTASASAQGTMAAAATDAVSVDGTAQALSAGGQEAQSAVDVGDSASTQQVVDAAAASSITVSDAATTAGGNVYDVSASESVSTGDAATGVRYGDIDALLEQIADLEAQLAAAGGGLGGGGGDRVEYVDIGEHPADRARRERRERIERQNDAILQIVRATVMHTEEPTP